MVGSFASLAFGVAIAVALAATEAEPIRQIS